jgi:hypothetical protein
MEKRKMSKRKSVVDTHMRKWRTKYKLENPDYNNNIENKKLYDSTSKKEYRTFNKVAVAKRRKKNIEERMKNDKIFKLKHSLRISFYSAFNNKGYKKPKKTEEILGCSIEFFKNYIESLFEDWMNWDNKGLYNKELNYGWDIDHKIPLSKANSIEEVIKLNHYTNLQPLCSRINRDIKRNI